MQQEPDMGGLNPSVFLFLLSLLTFLYLITSCTKSRQFRKARSDKSGSIHKEEVVHEEVAVHEVASSSQHPSLLVLSDELILLVVANIPHEDLVSLSRVSKGFNRCTVPEIYRYVYLHEHQRIHIRNYNHGKPLVPDWLFRYQHLAKPPPYATRIFDSSLFLRTITENEDLRSLIVGASFPIRDDQEEHVLPVVQVLQPSLKYLHLKLELLAIRQNRELVSTADCLEISLYEDNEIEPEVGGLPNEEYKEEIYSYFDLPNLRLFELSGIRLWDTFVELSGDRTGTSNITALSLANTVPADHGLAKLLSWPKALKSLRYELKLSEHIVEFYNRDGSYLSAKEFNNVLRSQHRSLEELYVYGDVEGGCMGFAPTETINLKPFTSLKYVGLPLNFLLISQPTVNFITNSVGTTDIFPPALEELQIEMTSETPVLTFPSSEEDDEDTIVTSDELINFLCEIVNNKARRYKNLREIVLWERAHGQTNEPDFLEGNEACRELVEACKAANVRFYWHSTWQQPLFGLLR